MYVYSKRVQTIGSWMFMVVDSQTQELESGLSDWCLAPEIADRIINCDGTKLFAEPCHRIEVIIFIQKLASSNTKQNMGSIHTNQFFTCFLPLWLYFKDPNLVMGIQCRQFSSPAVEFRDQALLQELGGLLIRLGALSTNIGEVWSP